MNIFNRIDCVRRAYRIRVLDISNIINLTIYRHHGQGFDVRKWRAQTL